jgi:hypothetical protein
MKEALDEFIKKMGLLLQDLSKKKSEDIYPQCDAAKSLIEKIFAEIQAKLDAKRKDMLLEVDRIRSSASSVDACVTQVNEAMEQAKSYVFMFCY